MSEINWPESLPLPSTDYAIDTAVSNTRLKMDTGRVRQYPIFSRGIDTASVEFVFMGFEFVEFKDFFDRVLESGKNWFNIDLPNADSDSEDQSLTSSEARFVTDYGTTYIEFNTWRITATIEYRELVVDPTIDFELVENEDGSYQWPEDQLGTITDFKAKVDTNSRRSKLDSGRIAISPEFNQKTAIAETGFEFDQVQYSVFRWFFKTILNLGNDWFTLRLPERDFGGVLVETRARFASDFKSDYNVGGNWDISASIEYEKIKTVLAIGVTASFDYICEFNVQNPLVATTDAEGIFVVFWEQLTGPAVTIDDPFSLETFFVATEQGDYQFRVTVSIGSITGSDEMRVTTLNALYDSGLNALSVDANKSILVPVVVTDRINHFANISDGINGGKSQEVTSHVLDGEAPIREFVGDYEFDSGLEGVTV